MSNLTVSYVSQTPPATPAGATAAAPDTDNPLGFLAALFDQLLAGGAEAVQGEIAARTGLEINIPGLMDLTVDTTPSTGFSATAPQPANLFAALGAQLDKLATQLTAGESPSPALLQDLRAAIGALGDALDALPATPLAADPPASIATTTEISRTATPAIADDQIVDLLAKLGLIEPPQTSGTDRPAATSTRAEPVANLIERLRALSQSLAATAPDLSQKLGALAAKIEAKPELAASLDLAEPQADADTLTIAQIIRTLLGHEANDAPAELKRPLAQVADAGDNNDLLKVLASLGMALPSTSGAAAPTGAPTEVAATASATNAVPAKLLRLSNQLSQVSTELAATSPELAKKLEAVATQLVSANADPDLFGKLTSAAAQPTGTALDKLVQSLVEPRTAVAVASVPTTPQVAAPAELTLPAPIAPKTSKSAATEVKAAPPEPAPVVADSAPRQTPPVTLTATARDAGPPEPGAEAKVAAIVADASRADPNAQQPATAPQPAPVAPQQARPLPAAYQPVANPINMGQVAFEMVRQVHQGTSRFTIRLDPPELGRVDVKLHVDNNGTVNARLTVDRAETLDLFQRDRQSLERALSQAGLDTARTNLEFSLRQQNHNPFAGMMGGDQRQQQPGQGGSNRFGLASADEVAAMPAVTLYRGTASAGGVNILA